MGTKEEFIDGMAAQLKEWSGKIDEMEAKVKKSADGAKTELNKQVEELKRKKAVAEAKLRQLKESGTDAWEAVRGGAEKAWMDLKESIHSAGEKFK